MSYDTRIINSLGEGLRVLRPIPVLIYRAPETQIDDECLRYSAQDRTLGFPEAFGIGSTPDEAVRRLADQLSKLVISEFEASKRTDFDHSARSIRLQTVLVKYVKPKKQR